MTAAGAARVLGVRLKKKVSVDTSSAGCKRQEEIGRGVAGVVYKTCCSGKCSYATKVFLSARDFASAQNEIALQTAVARMGLAPRILRADCTSGECKIVMERVRMTLAQYLKASGRQLTGAQQTSIIRLLERVARLGIDHGDVHSGNIAVDLPFKLRLIDFSEGSRPQQGVQVWKQVAKLVGDLGVLFPRMRFQVLEAYAAKARAQTGAHSGAQGNPCRDEEPFLRFVQTQLPGLKVSDPDVQDVLLDIWMDGPSNSAADCTALLRKIRRRFGLA